MPGCCASQRRRHQVLFRYNVSSTHFYIEGTHELVDIPDHSLSLSTVPEVPEGYEISRIDMVVRLRKKR